MPAAADRDLELAQTRSTPASSSTRRQQQQTHRDDDLRDTNEETGGLLVHKLIYLTCPLVCTFIILLLGIRYLLAATSSAAASAVDE